METANPKFHKFQLFILFLPLATLLVAFVLALLGHLVNLVVLAVVPLCCMIVSLVTGFLALRGKRIEIPASVKSKRLKIRVVFAILALILIYAMYSINRYLPYSVAPIIVLIWAWNELNFRRFYIKTDQSS